MTLERDLLGKKEGFRERRRKKLSRGSKENLAVEMELWWRQGGKEQDNLLNSVSSFCFSIFRTV